MDYQTSVKPVQADVDQTGAELTDLGVNEKLSLKEKVSYGLGDFGNGFMFDLGQAYLLKFFTDVCGIAAAAAGSIFVVSKIFDAFMDPLAGAFVDMRKSGKNGKFRPVMFFSSIILAVLTIIVFLSPGLSPTGKLIYAYVTYMAWGVLYSFTNDPYGSLGAAITQNAKERTLLASFRQAGSLGSLLIASVAFMPIVLLFANPKLGYPVAVAIFSSLGVLAFFFTFKNTRERVASASPTEKVSAKSLFRAVFENRALLVIILMTIFSIAAYNIKTAVIIYYVQYVLGNVTLLPYINFIIIGCSIIGLLVMPRLVTLMGKRKAAVFGFLLCTVADTLNFFLPTNVYLFTILASIAFFGISIPNGITWALISDSIDYGEWKTGTRREGITYAAFNFSRKLAQSLAGAVAGFGLAIVGYVANVQQTAQTIVGIRGLLLLCPAVATLIAAVVIGTLYNLDETRYKKILSEIHQRKVSATAKSLPTA